MQQLLHPKYLHDGIERSIHLELLSWAVLPLEGPLRDKGERTRWWSVFAAERQAMLQGMFRSSLHVLAVLPCSWHLARKSRPGSRRSI